MTKFVSEARQFLSGDEKWKLKWKRGAEAPRPSCRSRDRQNYSIAFSRRAISDGFLVTLMPQAS
ncbi:hypothetical protein, partial [Massilia timonae]|uniref:hypothetical protein n=1 Tax=Massilia timonae TaxID=47229 RepID=UPI00289E5E86